MIIKIHQQAIIDNKPENSASTHLILSSTNDITSLKKSGSTTHKPVKKTAHQKS